MLRLPYQKDTIEVMPIDQHKHINGGCGAHATIIRLEICQGMLGLIKEHLTHLTFIVFPAALKMIRWAKKFVPWKKQGKNYHGKIYCAARI